MSGGKLGPVDIEFFLKNLNIKEESQRIRSDIKGIGNTANDTNKILTTLGAGFGAYLSFQGLKGFGSELINVTGLFQKYEAVLTNSLESQDEAAKSMAMLADKAATTPAQLTELADAYVNLVNQGFKPSSKELTKLSDIASATGKGMGQLAEAIIDAQTGEFERLKEFGIRASKEGDKVSFTFKGVKQQVDFTAESIQQYILGLGDLNGVSGASAAIMGTLVGQVSNLEDAFANMLNEIGRSNEGILSGGINALSVVVTNYKEIGDVLLVLVSTYGAYKAAVIATVAWERAKAASAVQAALAGRSLTAWEVIHTTVLYKLNAAQKLLNSTISANPYALAFAALAALIGGLVIYNKWTNSATESQKRIAEVNKKAGDSFVEEKGKIDLLLSSARNQSLTDKQRLDAINKLKETIPGYNAELSKEGKLINENTKAIEQYLTQLELKIKMTAVQDELGELWKKEREQIKSVEQAEKELAVIRRQNSPNESGIVSGGDIGIAGAVSKIDIINRAKSNADQAKAKLDETRKVISDLKNEYSNAEKDLADFFNGSSGAGGGAANKKGRAYQLELDIKELQRLQSELSNTSADWESYNRQIEAKQKERDAITGNKKDEAKAKKDDQKELADYEKYQKELLERTRTYEEKKTAIQIQFEMDRQDKTVAGNAEKIAILDKQEKDALDDLTNAQNKELGTYTYLFDNIDKLGREALQRRIERLNEDLKITKLTAEEKLAVSKALSEAESALVEKAPILAIGKIQKRIDELKSKAAKATTKKEKDSIDKEITDATAKKGEALATIFGNVSSRLSEAKELAGMLGSEIGNAVELASGLASSFALIASGNYIAGAISAVTTLAKLFTNAKNKREQEAQQAAINRQKEANELIADANKMYEYQLVLLGKIKGVGVFEQLGRSSEALLNSLANGAAAIEKLDIGTEASKRWEKEWRGSWLFGGKVPVLHWDQADFSDLNNLMKNAITTPDYENIAKVYAEIEKIKGLLKDGTIFAASDADKEALQAQLDNYTELLNKAEELAAKQAEIFTGSTYDSVLDGLIKAFEDGIISAEEFATSFEELMKKAVLNSLKIQTLEAPLKEWYGQFAKLSESAGALTADEIATLRAGYEKIANDAAAKFEELKKLTGVDFGEASDAANNLSGAIQGMSQESADLLAGQLGAMRIHLADIATTITGRFNSDLKEALNTDELTNTFGLGLSTMNSTMQSMRDAALKANDHLFKIEVNTRELASIKTLLADNLSNRGYGRGFNDRRIGGR